MMLETSTLDFSKFSEATLLEMLEIYNGDFDCDKKIKLLETDINAASKIFTTISTIRPKKVAEFEFC